MLRHGRRVNFYQTRHFLFSFSFGNVFQRLPKASLRYTFMSLKQKDFLVRVQLELKTRSYGLPEGIAATIGDVAYGFR